MSTEESKSVVELAIFRKFVCASGLPVLAGSERKGSASLREPDVLCELAGEIAGFELAEACAPEFAVAASKASRSAEGFNVAWGDDVSAVTLRKKLAKLYAVAYPVHLLLYRNGLTALTDEIIIAKLRPELAAGLGQFQSVWFHGDAAHQVAVA